MKKTFNREFPNDENEKEIKKFKDRILNKILEIKQSILYSHLMHFC